MILFDDVGWGDFGCYGGGVAVGAPTPNIDRLAREGLLLTSCYSEPSCTPSRASLHDRPAPDAPRAAAPADVRRAGRPAGRGHDRRSCCPTPGYVTQAVGKWHMGENVESQPQNVGFDDFYGFLSRVGHVHRVARPVLLPRGRLQRGAHGVDREPCRSTSASCTPRGAARSRTSRRSRSRCSRCSTTSGRDYSIEFIRRMARAATQPWFLYHCTRGAHFDNYPHERFLGSSPAKHPYKDTIIELDDIVGRLVATLEETGQLEDTLDLHLVRQRAGDGDVARRRVLAVPLRQGLDVGGRRAGARRSSSWPGMIDGRPRVATACSRSCDLLPDDAARSPARPTRCPTDRYIDGVDQTSFLLAPDGRLEPQVPLLLARPARSRRSGSASTSSCSRRPPTTTPTC